MGVKCISISPLHISVDMSVCGCATHHVESAGMLRRMLSSWQMPAYGGGFLTPGFVARVELVAWSCSKVQLVHLSICLSGGKAHGLKIPHPLSAVLVWDTKVFCFSVPVFFSHDRVKDPSGICAPVRCFT